nr:hypothetical protein BaRGS_022346 [Batillaria attramentaria]
MKLDLLTPDLLTPDLLTLTAYKKICPRSKVCAIQTIQWPRPMKFPVCVHEFAVQGSLLLVTYGGCGGNGNNFRSKEECEKVCIDGRGDEEDDEGPTTLQPQTTRIVRFRGNQDADRYGGDVKLSDVASGLTSVLESGYAAEANETIRRFPSTGRRRRRGRAARGQEEQTTKEEEKGKEGKKEAKRGEKASKGRQYSS